MLKARFIRRTHRYLGLALGIQFLFWTISGLYFSWTDLDEIHGDHFKVLGYKPQFENNLNGISTLNYTAPIQSIELREIDNEPYYWINNKQLFNARTGIPKAAITKAEALSIASKYVIQSLTVKTIERLEKVDKHHEYRKKPLPVYVITYDHADEVKAYISLDGKFQTLRHRSWRWFDFLWMTHTMDYQSRDNFNTLLLRIFSLFGLITVLSGFMLWFVSSKRIRNLSKYLAS